MKCNSIVIGASLGGMEALKILFKGITGDFTIPITVVLHRGSDADNLLCDLFQKYCSLPVKQAEDKEEIKNGIIYFAPPDYHLLINDGFFSLSMDEQVNYSRPSIDILFESAADEYKNEVIGIILTGSNNDGACGALRIKENGGLVIVQDPKTALSKEMPEATINAVKVDKILTLPEISYFLMNLYKLKKGDMT